VAAPRATPTARRTAQPTAAEEPPPWVDLAPPEREGGAPSGCAALRTAALPAMAVPASPVAAAFVATPLGDRWAELAAGLVRSGAVAALVRELAQQAGLERIDAATQPPSWHLRVERDSLRSDALRDSCARRLAPRSASRCNWCFMRARRWIRRRAAMRPSANVGSVAPRMRYATIRWCAT
jgi:DNA polymerase-3 subunit gamma/tau